MANREWYTARWLQRMEVIRLRMPETSYHLNVDEARKLRDSLQDAIDNAERDALQPAVESEEKRWTISKSFMPPVMKCERCGA